MNNSHNNDIVNLCWTGGWDSTFRLLQLLLEDKRPVQPYYIIDIKRESFHTEIDTMGKIRTLIILENPFTEKLILPTIFSTVGEIKEDFEITFAYQKACKEKHIGSQYEWLARFCKHKDIYDMEIGCQKAANPISEPMVAHLLQRDGDTQIGIINKKYANTSEYVLFNYYRFPLLYFTKIDMYKIAKEKGWDNIMGKTWFCHHPKPGNIPCGKCSPCRGVISEHLGFRIPSSAGIISELEDTKLDNFYRRTNNYWKNLLSFIKYINPIRSIGVFKKKNV